MIFFGISPVCGYFFPIPESSASIHPCLFRSLKSAHQVNIRIEVDSGGLTFPTIEVRTIKPRPETKLDDRQSDLRGTLTYFVPVGMTRIERIASADLSSRGEDGLRNGPTSELGQFFWRLDNGHVIVPLKPFTANAMLAEQLMQPMLLPSAARNQPNYLQRFIVTSLQERQAAFDRRDRKADLYRAAIAGSNEVNGHGDLPCHKL